MIEDVKLCCSGSLAQDLYELRLGIYVPSYHFHGVLLEIVQLSLNKTV